MAGVLERGAGPTSAIAKDTLRTVRAGKGSQMAKNIYVGNLSWECTADDLLALFEEHGAVARAQVITDRETGRSRGFGFVEMEHDEEAQKAIDALNGQEHQGRPLTVNEARPREERSGGGGGRGGYSGGGGGRGGFGGGGGGGYGGGGRGGDRGGRY
jgi:RNA recognition motif-containing protein